MKKLRVYLFIFLATIPRAHAADVVTAIVDKLSSLIIERDNKVVSNSLKNVALKTPGMISEHADKSCASLSKTVFYYSETFPVGSMTDTFSITFSADNLAIKRIGTTITYTGPVNYTFKDTMLITGRAPENFENSGMGIFKFTIDTSKSPLSPGLMSFSFKNSKNVETTFNLNLEGNTYLQCAVVAPRTSINPVPTNIPVKVPVR